MGFKNLFGSSYKSGRRQGAVILISNKLNFEDTFELKDKEGRFILVRGTVDGNQVTSINVYVPPGSTFFQTIINVMPTETKGFFNMRK